MIDKGVGQLFILAGFNNISLAAEQCLVYSLLCDNLEEHTGDSDAQANAQEELLGKASLP